MGPSVRSRFASRSACSRSDSCTVGGVGAIPSCAAVAAGPPRAAT